MTDDVLDVYDIVEAFVAAQAAAPDDATVLNNWIRQYPQYGDDLLVASRQTWIWGPGWIDGEPDEDEDPGVIEAGRRVLSSLLPQKTPESLASATAAPLTSLVAIAKAKGLSSLDLARELHLDVPVLARLEQRLIRAATLPRSLVELIAEVLGRTAAEVAAYLRGGPSLAAGAHYKAQQAPTVGRQADFVEALASSREEIRAFWQGEQDVLGE